MLDSNDRAKSINKSIWGPRVYISCTLRHETMLVKRDTYELIGAYDENTKVISDWLWILKAYEFCTKVVILDKNILNFRFGGASAKNNLQRIKERQEAIMTNLHIDDKATIDLLMEPWLLSQREKIMLIKKHPENHKLHRALEPNRNDIFQLTEKLNRLYATKSWKITKPLRIWEGFFKKVR